jgi:hypothetical protein
MAPIMVARATIASPAVRRRGTRHRAALALSAFPAPARFDDHAGRCGQAKLGVLEHLELGQSLAQPRLQPRARTSATQLVEAEIDKATAFSVVPQYYLGFDKMHHAAHENCFIANSVKTESKSWRSAARASALRTKPSTICAASSAVDRAAH